MQEGCRRVGLLTALPLILSLGACQPGQGEEIASAAPEAPPRLVDTVDSMKSLDPLTEFIEQVGNVVYFETNSAALAATAEATLQRQAAWLLQNPTMTLTIEGHADERGTREYNLGLGERRASAIAAYLVALGVNANRLSVLSYGKERPLCSEAGEPCWAQNRRGVSALNL
jgi:peptidoglycan-associated lipoprotein